MRVYQVDGELRIETDDGVDMMASVFLGKGTLDKLLDLVEKEETYIVPQLTLDNDFTIAYRGQSCSLRNMSTFDVTLIANAMFPYAVLEDVEVSADVENVWIVVKSPNGDMQTFLKSSSEFTDIIPLEASTFEVMYSGDAMVGINVGGQMVHITLPAELMLENDVDNADDNE